MINSKQKNVIKYSALTLSLLMAGITFGGSQMTTHASQVNHNTQPSITKTARTQQGSHNISVTVQPGESLPEIANEYNSTVSQIMQANHMTSEVIHPGEKLIVPVNGTNDETNNKVYTFQKKSNPLSRFVNSSHNKSKTHLVKVSQNKGVTVSPSVKQANPFKEVTRANQPKEAVQHIQHTANYHVNNHTMRASRPSENVTKRTTHRESPVESAKHANLNMPKTQYRYYHKSNNNQNVVNNSGNHGSNQKAKNWIASRESRNEYTARNGKYVGKYQLDYRYLHNNYTPQNQERTADHYVKGRYGNWVNAKQFWIRNGWY